MSAPPAQAGPPRRRPGGAREGVVESAPWRRVELRIEGGRAGWLGARARRAACRLCRRWADTVDKTPGACRVGRRCAAPDPTTPWASVRPGRRRRDHLACARMDAAALRAQFPVLERIAYLNSGTDGPLPAAAVAAAQAELAAEVADGRVRAHFERRFELQAELRAGYARLIGAPPEEVALTTSTSDGLSRVLAGLDLRPGRRDRDVRSGAPGHARRAAAPRATAARTCAACPSPRWPTPSGRDTRLVAVSHVSWVGGERAPAALAELGVPGRPRRRAGRRRGAARRPRARLRRLRRLRAEVAVRGRRDRLPLARAGVRRARPGDRAELRVLRGPRARARLAAQDHRRPLRHAVARARDDRALAGGARRARGGGLGGGARARGSRRPHGWPPRSPSAGTRSRRAGTARS